MGGGSPDAVDKAAQREDEVVMAPVIDKGKKSEFEATGTSVKNNLPVTNSAAEKNRSNKEDSKNADKSGDNENAPDSISWDPGPYARFHHKSQISHRVPRHRGVPRHRVPAGHRKVRQPYLITQEHK